MMTTPTHRAIVQCMALVCLIAAAAWARVELSRGAPGTTVEVASLSQVNGMFVSVTALGALVGFSCVWDATGRTLTCARGGARVTLGEANPFYRFGRVTLQMPIAPAGRGPDLFLHAALIDDVLGALCGDALALTVADTSVTIALQRAEDADTLESPVAETTAVVPPVKDMPVTAVAPARARGQTIHTVAIDPGHGGKDPGAVGQNGVKEKDIVLAIALKVRDLLKESPDLKVFLTREKDVFVELQERTKFANRKKADLFVSIHANAVPGPKKRMDQTKGYKVYFLSQARNEEDRLVAMRENAVVQLEDSGERGDALTSILADMINNEYLAESQDLSILLDKTFEQSLKKKIDKLHYGIGQANFWVLNGAHMPSVLIETGFISHPDEEATLSDPQFQQKMAETIVQTIVAFREKYEGM
jgi:N-acetylmuramoyl-L-alanine amidase